MAPDRVEMLVAEAKRVQLAGSRGCPCSMTAQALAEAWLPLRRGENVGFPRSEVGVFDDDRTSSALR